MIIVSSTMLSIILTSILRLVVAQKKKIKNVLNEIKRWKGMMVSSSFSPAESQVGFGDRVALVKDFSAESCPPSLLQSNHCEEK